MTMTVQTARARVSAAGVGVRWAITVAVVAGMTSGCGLRRDLIEPPPFDGGNGDVVVVPTDGGSCSQHLVSGVGCVDPVLGCESSDVCPGSWALAQAQNACRGSAGTITLDTCADTYRWTYASNTVIDVVCYYTSATGALQGIDEQNTAGVYCGGSNRMVIGTIPMSCYDDSGTGATFGPCQDVDGGTSDTGGGGGGG
jgi:hypothetical protein